MALASICTDCLTGVDGKMRTSTWICSAYKENAVEMKTWAVYGQDLISEVIYITKSKHTSYW